MDQQKKIKLSKLDIVGIVLIVLFLPIIITNLVLVIKGAVNPSQVPTVFGTAPLIVISDSMTIDEEAGTGAFNKGDLIVITKVNPEKLEVNDIITYINRDGDVVTHRIKGFVTEDGEPAFETKGDASPGYDLYGVKYNQIVGKYSGIRLAGLGDVAIFFQKPEGVILILGVPLALMVAYDLLKKSKEKVINDSKTAELEAEIARLKAEKAESKKEDSEE